MKESGGIFFPPGMHKSWPGVKGWYPHKQEQKEIFSLAVLNG